MEAMRQIRVETLWSNMANVLEGLEANERAYAEKEEELEKIMLKIREACNNTLDVIASNKSITVVETKFAVNTFDGLGELASRAASIRYDLVVIKGSTELLKKLEAQQKEMLGR